MHGSRGGVSQRRRRRPWHHSRAVVDQRRWVVPNGVVVLGIMMLVASWWYATDSVPTTVDRSVGRWAVQLPDSLDTELELVMKTGSVWFCAVAAAVAVCAGRFRLALGIGMSALTAWIGSAVIERIVSSPRPTTAQLGAIARDTASGGGYPSTPVAMAAAMSLMLLTSVRSTRVVSMGRPLGADTMLTLAAIAVALATGLGTMYLGINWFTDVIGGAGLGIVAGVIGVRAGRRRRSIVSNQWI